MARLSAEPTKDTDRNRWKLDIPAGMSETGKRVRLWFGTREEAREHAAKIYGSHFQSSTIPTALAVDADKARIILNPWNLDLTQAAREVAAALEILGTSGNIREAALAFRAAHEDRISSKRLGDAVALYLDSKINLRNATLLSYRYSLERVLVTLHAKPMADITTAEIEAILSSKAPTSRTLHKRNIRVFWKWASAPPRRWSDMATVDDMESIRHSSDADICILKVQDVKALLCAAELESPAAAAAYSIAIFAGVRMAELGRLRWSSVGEDYIEIGRGIAKKHSRRYIPACPTLRAWLAATRNSAANETLIVPPNWVDVSKSVRRRAGWDVSARLLLDPPKPTRGPWPANACRHTCASVQVAIGTPLQALTFSFGHSGGHDLLRKHYVHRLSQKDALEILATGPNGSKISSFPTGSFPGIG